MQERPFSVDLEFSIDLRFFLGRDNAGGRVSKRLREKTSVKDVIESCGVPHPEVDRIECDGVVSSFAHQIAGGAGVRVFGTAGSGASVREGLQERGIFNFVADGHLGKLVRILRLLGFDVCYPPGCGDAELVAIASGQSRALLTRDRRLLMHRAVGSGYYPRSQEPEAQTVEVIQRFELNKLIAPFTRCINCNGELSRIDKREVLDQLEPLTRIYYHDFRRCVSCGKIYWPGSHFEKLQRRIENIRKQLP